MKKMVLAKIKGDKNTIYVDPANIKEMMYVDENETLVKCKRTYWLEYLKECRKDISFEDWLWDKEYDYDTYQGFQGFIFKNEDNEYLQSEGNGRSYKIEIGEDDIFVIQYLNGLEEIDNIDNYMNKNIYINPNTNEFYLLEEIEEVKEIEKEISFFTIHGGVYVAKIRDRFGDEEIIEVIDENEMKSIPYLK